MNPKPDRAPPVQAAVTGLAPFVHVADVERSLEFYEQLGLVRMDTLEQGGRTIWGSMRNGQAQIMFVPADPLVEPGLQGVLFYLYSDDIIALRAHLVRSGVPERAAPSESGKPDPRGVVFPIRHPEYMPAGELRVHDPDGYCLLIGQRE